MIVNKCFSVLVLLITLVGLVRINVTVQVVQYIAGGQPAAPFEFPFMASIRRFGIHYCGASIVNERYLVTAAHCTYNQTLKTIDVVTGTNTWNSGGFIHKLKDIIIHELYHYEADVYADNDISLLVVELPIIFSKRTAKLSFPSESIKPNTEAILIGWGRTTQSDSGPQSSLQTLRTRTITNLECSVLSPNRTLTFSNFCTLNPIGQGGCYGDSGSPLLDPKTHDVLGLYSWVVAPCGTGIPDGYTKMWEYIDWINLHTRKW